MEEPTFFSSDRNKGLIPAMQVEAGCVVQMTSQWVEKKNGKAQQWLLDADELKWVATYSIRPRFGTMASNNVESGSNVLLEARDRPILDCLMAVEK